MTRSPLLRATDMRSNFIEVALDDRGRSCIVRIESPTGDVFHTFDPQTGIVKTGSRLGTAHPAQAIRYGVKELRCNGSVVNRECVPRVCIG